jgi:uncharacterized protein YggU (UPF0235/DUF167 family)
MIISVRVKTGTIKDTLTYNEETHEYLVTVKARPMGGQANNAIIQLLAKELKVPKSLISLESGSRSKNKRFRIQE